MRTRFAPSPTGPLHLGHAYSALLAHDMARAAGGTFLIRIEDIDQSRARPEWEKLIYTDLAWLGLTWETPVMRQSERQAAYDAALDHLWAMGLLYPCTCKRRDILAAVSAPHEGDPPMGPDGIVYPGTCRPAVPPKGARPKDVALRLNMARALELIANDQSPVTNSSETTSTFPTFNELGEWATGDGKLVNIAPPTLCKDGLTAERPALTDDEATRTPQPTTCRKVKTNSEALTAHVGDVVLSRRDMGTSYHLSVVVDDAAQGITHVIRGADLFETTPIHLLLQRLLGTPTPHYLHHPLVRDEAGKRLAKRDDARALRLYREDEKSPEDIRHMAEQGLSSY